MDPHPRVIAAGLSIGQRLTIRGLDRDYAPLGCAATTAKRLERRSRGPGDSVPVATSWMTVAREPAMSAKMVAPPEMAATALYLCSSSLQRTSGSAEGRSFIIAGGGADDSRRTL